MEVFKKSAKSICNKCSNINNICSLTTHKTCETDTLSEYAYVSKCMSFNNQIIKYKSKSSKTISCARPESRIEMMGGGHKDFASDAII